MVYIGLQWKTLLKLMIWGVFPLFSETPICVTMMEYYLEDRIGSSLFHQLRGDSRESFPGLVRSLGLIHSQCFVEVFESLIRNNTESTQNLYKYIHTTTVTRL